MVAGHTEIKLKLTRKCPACWLVFIVLEGAMQAAVMGDDICGLTQYWCLHVIILSCQARCAS